MAARELSDDEKKALRKRLLRGVRLILQGDPGVTLSGQPVEDFLAAPAPGNPFSAWQHKAGRAACDRWARRTRGAIAPGRDLYYRNLCEPYLGSGLPDLPTQVFPFTGGQCVTNYVATYERRSRSSFTNGNCGAFGAWSTPQTSLLGTTPVVGPVTAVDTVIGGPSGNFTDASVSYAVRHSGGTAFLNLGGVATRGFAFSCGVSWEFRNLAFTRSDGQPDTCGNPEALFDPGNPNPTADPNPGPVGGPPGYGFPGFDVQINPDGSIAITFGDGSAPVTIDPGDGLDQPPPPGDLGEPGTPANTGAGGDAEGEAPDGQVLVGLKLGILSTPPQAKEFQEGFYRGAVYIFMGAADGLDMDYAGSIVRNGQFVLAEKDNLTKWFVAANPGYNFAVTPYYREAE